MKIKDCNFNNENIFIGVLPNGKVLLGNIDTKTVYEVSIVKPAKLKPFEGYKTVKNKGVAKK